jgi:hypothetical protein
MISAISNYLPKSRALADVHPVHEVDECVHAQIGDSLFERRDQHQKFAN